MAKQACQVPTGTASKEVFAWAFDAEIAFCTRDSVLTQLLFPQLHLE